MNALRSLRLGAAALATCTLSLAGCAVDFHDRPIAGAPKGGAFADVGGASIHYVDEGAGPGRPTVVLVHGFASSLGVWSGLRKALASEYRVIALDLKGFGHSSRPEGDYSPAAEARIVLDLLEARGVTEKVAIVAHSWGSSVALSAALQAPDRIAKIALYDAWVYEEQLPAFFLWARAEGLGEMLVGAFYDERPDDKMAGAFFDPKYVSEPLIETVEEQLARPGTKAAALAAIRGQRYAEVETRYPTIAQPTLLLWGREDRVTTLPFGERLSKELPNARLAVYPQCGHFPMIEAVAPSTRDLKAFLAEPAKGWRDGAVQHGDAASPAPRSKPSSDAGARAAEEAIP